jgi:hypothetical protein
MVQEGNQKALHSHKLLHENRFCRQPFSPSRVGACFAEVMSATKDAQPMEEDAPVVKVGINLNFGC